MNKLWLVLKREYIVRVRKRTFIIATILMPLGIAALTIGSGVLTALGSNSKKNILVVDQSGVFENSDTPRDKLEFTFTDGEVQEMANSYASEGYDLLIHIPPFNDLSKRDVSVTYYSQDKQGIAELARIEGVMEDAFREYKINESNIDRSVYDSFRTRVSMESADSVTEEGKKSKSGKVAAIIGTVLGFAMGFMMYMVVLIYGQMVMRSVMEEKISRISEVMISSIKPFQLMLGKILGVGAVGLTQLAIWMVLIPVILTIVPLFIPGAEPADMATMTNGAEMQAVQEAASGDGFDLGLVINEFFGLNWLLIVPSFIIFFLGGYFIYSSLFGAIGSVVDEDLGEAQQFVLPVMIPVIFALLIMMSAINNPNGGLAVFGSIFPLFSPIIMPARLPFDPPLWQVLLSITLLIGTTLLFIWLSARIYRVGILLYGKKVTFKELGRWMFAKN